MAPSDASAPEPPSPSPARSSEQVPPILAGGRYELVRFLGEGAKKRVHLARDTRLDRDVAIAFVKSEGLDMARVRREAEAMGRLGDHPSIVTVHDVDDEKGQGAIWTTSSPPRTPTAFQSTIPSALRRRSVVRSSTHTRATSCTAISSRATSG